MASADITSAVIEDLLRELAPQVLTALLRRYRDFDTAEDAVQEALLAAALQWPESGLPDNPRAWLIQVAFRRMTDRVRSDIVRRRREDETMLQMPVEQQIIPSPDAGWSSPDRDDTLILLFMCCHPSLTPASATTLTLRAVGGLTTAEIAKAFMVPESTMAQRISRAKQSIKSSGVPFTMPTPAEYAQRLGIVLHVLYLIFNEGYTTSAGPSLQRTDLSNEAIRLARMLHRALPENAEATGLLALMLLTDARRLARVGPEGELIPLAEQDRSQWDAGAIAEGIALVSDALPRGEVGSYQLQAAIAAIHDEAARVEDTDWPQILALYAVLERLSDNPMVALNAAIAHAMVHGAAAGLERLDAIEAGGRLAGHHRLHAVRAHLLEMAGHRDSALFHYRAAASRTASLPEQRYLLTRAARLAAAGDDAGDAG
jgi:RNA polymerase sigma factor (sigma-70 family)